MSYTSWRKHVASQPQCNFKVTKHPLTATFTHPGLNFSNFDRDGKIDIVNLLPVLLDLRIFPHYYPYTDEEEKWFTWDGVDSDRSLFISSVEIVLSRNMHNRQVPKWPLEAKVLLGYIGNSSVAILLEVYNPGSQEPLLTQTLQMVGVDTKTRKPKLFPDWFLNKYNDQCSQSTGFRLQTFHRPVKTFMYRREVMWLETDLNNHTNFASYVRYALDGLHSAIKHQEAAQSECNHLNSAVGAINDVSSVKHPDSSVDVVSVSEGIFDRSGRLNSLPATILHTKSSSGGLKGLTKDIIKEGLKSLKVCYVNECVEGEIIDVHVWQEENETYIVRCSVEKGSQIICQIILEYFSPLSKL